MSTNSRPIATDAEIAEATERHRAEIHALLEELDVDELSPAASAMLHYQLKLIMGRLGADQ